ncbi:NAD(P)/FAD-dependent oxidoreductase [Patescibacteria group bacterium]
MFLQINQKKGDPWDVAIIGSGPSGLTAGIYTTRGAASTIIIGGTKWGGQLMLTTEVDNFPTQKGIKGPDLMKKMRDHALSFGGEFVPRDVESTELSTDGSVHKIKTHDAQYLARSVIIATGAQTRWLGVPGEDKFLGRGVSSCAPCDAPFFKNKKVIVVGGGDSAMEEALVLTKYASFVLLVHRRDEFRASKAMQQKVISNDKIAVVWDTEITKMMGEGVINRVNLKTAKTSKHLDDLKEKISKGFAGKVLDEDGIDWSMPIDGVFVAIGHVPTTSTFKGQIELDKKGYVVKHSKDGFQMATSAPGVFVAGDVHDFHYRQAITASGFGCMAGLEALLYLDKPSPNY